MTVLPFAVTESRAGQEDPDPTLSWTLLAYDLVTDRPIADLPVRPGNLVDTLNNPGSLDQLTVPMDALGDLSRREVIDATEMWRTAVYLDLDGELVWGGLITDRFYDSDTRVLTLPVIGWAAYYAKQIITTTLAWDDVDQLAIVRDIFNVNAARPGFPKLAMNTVQTSGVLRDRTYAAADLKRVLEAVKDMQDNLNGFDWRIDVARDDRGVPTRQLVLGYPQLGADPSISNLAFDYTRLPDGSRTGNVDKYTWPENGQAMRTETWGTTETEEGVVNLESFAHPTMTTSGGYPLLQEVLSGHDTVTSKDTLIEYVKQDTAYNSVPIIAATVTVDHRDDTLITRWEVGDWARLTITDDRFPSPDGRSPGLDKWVRTTSRSLDIATNKLTVTLEPFPEIGV